MLSRVFPSKHISAWPWRFNREPVAVFKEKKKEAFRDKPWGKQHDPGKRPQIVLGSS